eukprot:scaffold53381_cov62-Phaeocystis_antarctica.AAC.6
MPPQIMHSFSSQRATRLIGVVLSLPGTVTVAGTRLSSAVVVSAVDISALSAPCVQISRTLSTFRRAGDELRAQHVALVPRLLLPIVVAPLDRRLLLRLRRHQLRVGRRAAALHSGRAERLAQRCLGVCARHPRISIRSCDASCEAWALLLSARSSPAARGPVPRRPAGCLGREAHSGAAALGGGQRVPSHQLASRRANRRHGDQQLEREQARSRLRVVERLHEVRYSVGFDHLGHPRLGGVEPVYSPDPAALEARIPASHERDGRAGEQRVCAGAVLPRLSDEPADRHRLERPLDDLVGARPLAILGLQRLRAQRAASRDVTRCHLQ